MAKLYFLRAPGVKSWKRAHILASQLRGAGMLRREGLGTEADTDAAWYVLSIKAATVEAVRAKLVEIGMSAAVDLIEPILSVKDGQAVARQLPMFTEEPC